MTTDRIRAEREEAQRQTRVAGARKQLSELQQRPDHSYLTMDRPEAELHEQQRAADLTKAQRELDSALAENGGALGNALRSLPGGTALVTTLKSSGYEYQRRTGVKL
jgi:hypothetical protein